MLAFLLPLLGNIFGPSLVSSILDGYKATLTAANSAEKIRAELASEVAQVNEQRDALSAEILVAEQGNWFTRGMRPAFAYPIAFYLGKIFVWDKCLGLGMTDRLSPELSNIVGIVIAGLFGTIAVESAAKVFRK